MDRVHRNRQRSPAVGELDRGQLETGVAKLAAAHRLEVAVLTWGGDTPEFRWARAVLVERGLQHLEWAGLAIPA